MASGPSPSLPASRPLISVDGRYREALSTGLVRLSIEETVSGIYRCEATFGNWGPVGNSPGYLYFDRQTLEFGKAFQVGLKAASLFDGRIMALEAAFAEDNAPEITVRAEDRLEDLRMTRRTRTFTSVSDADILRQVASDHGLTAEVDAPGPTHKVVAQVNQSDLHFLRERVRSIDAELWMEGTTLHAQSRSTRDAGTLTLSLGGALREFTVAADLHGQRTSVSVSGWDVDSKSAIVQGADDSAISGELNGGDSGPSILTSTFGEHKESLTDTIPLDGAEAQADAEAVFRTRARRFVAGHGVAETDASLRVGAYVDLQELGPLFSGSYYVTGVHHIFDPTKGMRTEFTAERPGLGRP